ncbi:hypothetical protein ThidrDRAFT_4592 [Thiorhodococcus drewsii AZ1]|uniref:Sulfotransferase family protein n=1 Tax=Thiorhodococcus drewsii AZ1 TaxID=765913 RepID=G2E8H8_9GAMM|nr:sulfotransferase family 2 domain-containing protein [Thiorhodococcus drewsii]EGV27593.1 hypothetical protein ThidrDRAFT_4592 [Thiorhodococcus drewsii AZ1]
MPNFALNGFEFYDAPKNGGTTVRLWLKYAEGSLPADFARDGYYTLAGVGLPRQWTDTVMGPQPFFAHGAKGNRRWCITRDPVERFISAYTDKILRETLTSWSVDTCLDLLESGEMERIARSTNPTRRKQAACHLLGQCIWFGRDRGYFDHVFSIAEMDRVREFCEDKVFKMPLPAFHGRNQSRSGIDRVIISAAQRDRLERIFAEDYEVGWCSLRQNEM